MSDVTDYAMKEVLQRCINIELKVNSLIESENSNHNFSGNPDQHFGFLTYAQHGDDLIAINIFHNIGIKMPSYLDIGAHHPLNISNTALLYDLGCRGINVEPNPNLIEKFYELRPDDINLNIGVSDSTGDLEFYMIDQHSGRNSFDRNSVEAFVKQYPEFQIREVRTISVITVNEIVEKYANGTFPDFLSLDVEGLDLKILQSMLPADDGPKVICVEYISGDSTVIYDEIKNFMDKMGYFAVFKTVGNAFFALEKYRSALQ